MVSFIAIPLLIGHDVNSVNNDSPIEKLAPVLANFNLGESKRQLVSLAYEHFGVVGDGLAEVDISTISLVEDYRNSCVPPFIVVYHED